MGKYLVVGLLAVAPYALALEVGPELTVLSDKGGVSTSSYYRSQPTSASDTKSKRPASAGNYMSSIFPIRTKAMAPGKVGPDEMPKVPPSYVMTNPIFIIGDDPLSLDWLKRNKAFLAGESAVGLVVNVETPARMNEIRRIAGPGVKITISPGDELSESLGIKHYPFYLGRNGVMR
ncbi:hypothetical protein DOK_11746 [gamma proteobacterium BDW918]|nr:hypothetical protein DOK_11746 [gamma proteobacterium BDW918]